MYRHRWIEKAVRALARTRPALYVGGARQVGKTTLLRATFPRARYVSFDLPVEQRRALDDPRLFIETCGRQAILDEIQHVPDLLPYLKAAMDADRRPGRWLLTGSQHYAAMRHLSETLAGRVGILSLQPFSVREWHGRPPGSWPAWMTAQARRPPCPHEQFWQHVQRGMFPELCVAPRINPANWFDSYLISYLERDLRSQLRVGSIRDFERFLRAVAVRTAQLVNYTDLARDVGIAVSTAREWVSVLEGGFQVRLLEPYHRNLGKRLVKSPKLYWLDTGLAAHLLGIRSADELIRSPFAGALFENWVVAEIGKQLSAGMDRPPLWFWQTSNGTEVDLVVEQGSRLWPCEIKTGTTFRDGWIAGLRRFLLAYGAHAAHGTVINLGEHQRLSRDIVLANARCW